MKSFNKLIFVLFLIPSLSWSQVESGRITKPQQKKLPVGLENAPDAALISALLNRKEVNFVEAKQMKVVKVLPDDRSGSPHQKFNVSLSNQSVITIISNLDMCPQIPVQVGDVVGAGGEFIPTGKKSGILHWVHKDPRKNRPDGYIEFKGQEFCK